MLKETTQFMFNDLETIIKGNSIFDVFESNKNELIKCFDIIKLLNPPSFVTNIFPMP